MEQPSIFEEHFATAFQVRRRRLLPVFLKLYIWIGFLVSLLCLIGISYSLYTDLLIHHHHSRRNLDFFEIMEFPVGLGLVTIFFTAVASLWFEAKWAIRYNWVLGAVLLAGVLFSGVILIKELNESDISILFLPALTIPYFVMLYKIQYRWEHVAVSKKEALTATPMK